jgi:branched-subunit amino acid transport protein AzlD
VITVPYKLKSKKGIIRIIPFLLNKTYKVLQNLHKYNKIIGLFLLVLVVFSCKKTNRYSRNVESSQVIPDSIYTIEKKGHDQKNINLSDKANFEIPINVKESIITSLAIHIGKKFNYIISRGNFRIFKFSKNYEKKIKTFGRSGRGPGEGNFISAYAFTDNEIFLYDATLRKLVCFKLNGKLKFEKIIQNKQFPVVMNGFVNIKKDLFIATGVSGTQQRNPMQGKKYDNVYLMKIAHHNIKILDSASILPTKILEGIKNNNVIASTVSNPFKLSKRGRNVFLYDMLSGSIFSISISNNRIICKYEIKLGKNLFKRHISISQNQYNHNSTKMNEWLENGDYMIDVFSNKKYLFFYTSSITENGKLQYNLVRSTRHPFNITGNYTYKSNKIIRLITDKKVYFLNIDQNGEKYIFSKMNISVL